MLFENETRYGIPGVDENGNEVETAAFYMGPELSGSTVRNCVIDGMDAHWGLKLAHAFDITFEDCVIRGGTERALDIVRGGAITFRGCHFERGDNRGTTRKATSLDKTCDIGIKAGARDVTFESCTMNDLLLGDYSVYDQLKGRPKTRRVFLHNCTNPNAWPIIVRAIYADKAIVQDTPVSQFRLPSLVTWGYFTWNRHFGDKRDLTDYAPELLPEDLV